MTMRSATGIQPFDVEAVRRERETAPPNVGRASERRAYGARVVNCDATFDNDSGVGFIAVTGALGPHVRRVHTHSSVAAEALAILFAMELGEVAGGRPLVLIFRTDCSGVAVGCQPGVKACRDRKLGSVLARIKRTLSYRRQWEVQHVDRGKVAGAHKLAGLAARAYGAEPGAVGDAPLWSPS